MSEASRSPVVRSPVSNSPVSSSPELKQVSSEKADIGWRTWAVVFVSGFVFLAQAYTVIAAGSVVAFIVRDLGGQSLAGWIVQGPLLMQAVLAPTVGRLSDVIDRKWLATVPTLLGAAGAITAARADTMPMLVGASILIGTTLSTVPTVQAIPAEVLPVKWRIIANAVTFIGAAIGGLVGQLGAGAITNTNPSGWRGIFWLQAGLHLASFLGLVLFYHPKRGESSWHKSWKRIIWLCDPIGSFLFIGGSANLLLAFDWAGLAYPWRDAHVLGPLIVGAVLLIAFAAYEWKGRDDGLIAHAFFRNGPNFALACGSLMVEGWMFYAAANILIPQIILNLGFASDAWTISLRQLALSLPAMVLVVPISLLTTRYKSVKIPLLVGYFLFLVAAIGFCFLNPTLGGAQIAFSVLISAGQAAPLLLLLAIVQLATPHAFLSTASGLALSARAIGGAFGTAALAAIVGSRLQMSLPEAIAPVVLKAGLPKETLRPVLLALATGQPQLIEKIPLITPQIFLSIVEASRPAFAHAYDIAWASVIPFIVVAMVAVLLLRGVREKLDNEEVEAPLESNKRLSS